MLGKLARWLRILGYDTAYEKVIADETLVERALEENRRLLTRDRHLARRKILRGRHTLIRDDAVENQMRQLHAELHLELDLGEETPTRCPECNLPLEPLSREDGVRLVPPFVAEEHTRFARCPGCAHVYWPGTQWAHLRAQLKRLRVR